MCGIAGMIGKPAADRQSPERLTQLLTGIKHRGPDDQGVYQSPTGGAAIGMVRLSIIDLSHGHQPMLDSTRRHAFVFNGELYNFQSLRQDLAKEGVRFSTQSDTEVAFQALLRWGVSAALNRFDGMFAFCLWDEQSGTATLGRDAYGEKPLFYSADSHSFVFASELQPLVKAGLTSRQLHRESVIRYLTHQFNSSPETLIRGVNKLLPGHWASVRTQGRRIQFETHRYFAPEKFAVPSDSSTRLGPLEAQLQVKSLIEHSVASRLIADVPVGVFLSGGLDSSIIAYEAVRKQSDIQTFSIAFEDPRFNEAEFSQKVAKSLGTKHQEFVFSAEDFCREYQHLIQFQSEPLADAAAIPTSLLSRHARQKVKVVLSGEGADEIFGGYAYYHEGFPFEVQAGRADWTGSRFYSGFPSVFDHAGLRKLLGRLRTLGVNLPEEDAQKFLASLLEDRPVAPFSTREQLNSLLTYDQLHWLPGDLLVKTDMTTMAHSLECRAPYLNRELHRLVFGLSPHLRAKNEIPKYLLKLLYAPLLPEEIVFRKKQGFGLPLDQWFREGKLKAMAEASLFSGSIAKSKFFQPRYIRELWSKHQAGENHERRLLCLMTLDHWMTELRLSF